MLEFFTLLTPLGNKIIAFMSEDFKCRSLLIASCLTVTVKAFCVKDGTGHR